MIDILPTPVLFGLVAATVATLGLIAVAFSRDWSLRGADLLTLTAAGMLITIVFVHVLPKSLALSQSAPIWIAVGFFLGFFMHHGMGMLSTNSQADASLTHPAIPIVAIAIHSFVDGIIYSVNFAAGMSVGILATSGLILHEFPEAVIAFAMLRQQGISKRNAIVGAFLAAAVTTPLGAMLSGPIVVSSGDLVLGGLFAFSAGLLLFVATGPLTAPLKKVAPTRGGLAVGTGIVIATSLLFAPIPGHDHAHTHASHIGHHFCHDHGDHLADLPRFK